MFPNFSHVLYVSVYCYCCSSSFKWVKEHVPVHGILRADLRSGFCSSCSLLLCCIYIRLEHGSNGSSESFAYPKKYSDRYCGPSRGPRRGVPGSECPFDQGEMSKGKTKGQENMPSSLLSSQENECLLELLGRRCVVSEVTLISGPIKDGHSVPQRILGMEINQL